MTLRELMEHIGNYADRPEYAELEVMMVSDFSDTMEEIEDVSTYHSRNSPMVIGIVAKERE